MVLELRKAQPHDFPALQQMLELYQYELSDIWPQEADSETKYGYNLERHKQGERFHAHVALEGAQYVGFALVAPAVVTRKEGNWMEQFFILKRFRRSGAGYALARHVLLDHPGAWEVGQMPANLAAQAFWRSVIEKITSIYCATATSASLLQRAGWRLLEQVVHEGHNVGVYEKAL